jgi:DHA1 family bicyclomycin/chloramphenicol resistance-like MFS transporter
VATSMAVSIRPQAAGTAAGLTGFTQMATGAASTQVVSVLLAASSSAMPMAWMLVGLVVATAVSFAVLARR